MCAQGLAKRILRPWLVFALSSGMTGTTTAPDVRKAGLPEQIAVDGGNPLRIEGHAHRTHLLGTIDLYTLGLYSDGPIDRARLASVDVTKVLRIEITYQEDLRRRVALDWQRELIPALEPRAVAHLRGAFAPLRRGDTVQIEYVPEKGTSVRVNRAVSVSNAHHDLMLAFLDHWLGERPLSEEVKRTLLGTS
jgi:hypothetical protein